MKDEGRAFFNTLRLDREPPRSMYPDELVRLLWRFKHTRIQSIGVDCNRWGARPREEVGLPPHGTIWITGNFQREVIGDVNVEWPEIRFLESSKEVQKETLFPIRCNSIPYTTLRGARWNPDTHRFDGETVRGWRPLLSYLTKLGIFYPNDELTWLMGEDSWRVCPRELAL